MSRIVDLKAYEILDSRGRPTILTRCQLESGVAGQASVPSGASTGKHEAVELRDGNVEKANELDEDNFKSRFQGLGCRQAIENIHYEIKQALVNSSINSRCDMNQQYLDKMLIELDGTENKSRLGANAILSVSLAFARAAALERQVPLHNSLADLLPYPYEPKSLPRPTINLFSGGRHAGFQVPIQDVLIVPIRANTFQECMVVAYDVYQAAVELCRKKYTMRWLTADEGGLAPPCHSADEMIERALEAIEAAGYICGRDVGLAIDAAASQYYDGTHYRLGRKKLTSEEMLELLERWIWMYPIVSLEDGLAEDDWRYWSKFTKRFGDRILIVGDDLLCTNPKRIRQAITMGAVNTLLLKVNQIGTLYEALEAFNLVSMDYWHVTVSARSGETEDDWLADLAVGWGIPLIKIGSITQSERLAKYNRLLVIEQDTNFDLCDLPVKF